jgi:mannose-6-phosphate isomerase-like protein (cupin superfamily)
MLKVIRKSETRERKVADNKSAFNYITKDISPDVSLAVIEGTDYFGETTTIPQNRIYFVLQGNLILDSNGEKTTLHPEDSCFISAGTQYSYVMSGTFKIITIDQPAYGVLVKN